MFWQIVIGAALIFASVAVQLAFIGWATSVLTAKRAWFVTPPHSLKMSIGLGLLSLWLMAGHSVSVWLWAVSFLALDIFQDLETALYFSVVIFTTLGFGDIIPPQPWRLLAGVSAANGLLIFGVSTAFLAEAFRRIWSAQHDDDDAP